MRISVFSNLASYLAVGGARLDSDMSGGAFVPSFTLVLHARLAPIPRLPILGAFMPPPSLSHLKLVCSRSATLDLATAQTRLSSARRLKHWTWRLHCCFPRTGQQHVLGLLCTWHLLDHLHLSLHPCFLRVVLMCGGIMALNLCWHVNVHVLLL